MGDEEQKNLSQAEMIVEVLLRQLVILEMMMTPQEASYTIKVPEMPLEDLLKK